MSAPPSRSISIGLGAILLLGAALRLREYLNNRPLWLDEAMLALNIGRRGYLGLLSPLTYDQAASPLFLWGVKTITVMAGMGEHALRALPLLAGVLLPWVVWRMARVLGGDVAGFLSALLAAMSVPLIYYSAELKPYALDAVATAGIILLTCRVRSEPERARRWHELLGAGMLAFLLSIPVPLVFCGSLLALLSDPRVRSAPRAGRRLATLAAGWGAWVGLMYLVYHRLADTPYLRRFWMESFFTIRPGEMEDRNYALAEAILDPLPPILWVIRIRWLLVAAGLGLILVFRRYRAPVMLQVVVPVLAVVTASVLHVYPVNSRLLLFLAPCLFAFVGLFLAEVLRLARFREPAALVAGAILVAGWAFPRAIENARNPRVVYEGRETARRVLRADSTEPVYILPGGIPAWSYYTTDWQRPDTVRVDLFLRAGASTGPASLNDLVPEERSSGVVPLSYSGTGRLELLGRRSGLAYRETPSFESPRNPRPGWAKQEVERIAAVARPYAWLYGVHWTAQEFPELRAELARRGIDVVETVEEKLAVALRIRVSRPQPADSGSGPVRSGRSAPP